MDQCRLLSNRQLALGRAFLRRRVAQNNLSKTACLTARRLTLAKNRLANPHDIGILASMQLPTDRKISESHAKFDDAAQMAIFLASIPDADGLAGLLMQRRVVSTRTFDDDAMVARFVRSNGDTVACYTVDAVTIDEAEMIAAQCELLDDWSVESFSNAVHVALDPDL